LAWLHGKPGAGKSFVAVDLACCVGTAKPWHGYTTTQGQVLYLIAEGASGIAERVDAWELAHNCVAINTHFLPVPARLADPRGAPGVDVAGLGMLLKELRPVLVILDTQARVTVGAEENSSKDMGLFVESLELLRQWSRAAHPSTVGACILTVHHEPRGGENLRGSIALDGAAESILSVQKDGDLVTLKNPKQKNAPAMEELELALEPRGESAVLVRRGWEHDTMTDSARQLLEVLKGFGEGKVISKTEWLEASGMPKSTYYAARRILLQKRLVLEVEIRKGQYGYRLPPAEDDA
jgi:hypothetical protein